MNDIPKLNFAGLNDHMHNINAAMAEFQENAYRKENPATVIYEALKEYITLFENHLNDEQEVSIQLASFGQTITMHVVKINPINPNMILFSGYVGTEKSFLIQHVNQLSFLLVASKKHDPEKPARRIGFN